MQTPGPWEHDELDPARINASGDGEMVACCGLNGHHDGFHEVFANARLIAAAPELLEALRPFADLMSEYERVLDERDEAIEWHKFLDEFSWPTEEQCRAARISIRKARGKT